MKLRKMSILLMIGVIMLISGAEAADVLYVDNGGSGLQIASTSTITIYPSINAAIAAANPGDTIHIYNGVYDETLDVTKSLIIEGDSRAGVIIDCAGIGGYGIGVNADNVTLRSFTLNNSTSYGIKPSGVSNVLIEDITVMDCGRTGIDLNGVTDSVVNNVEITGTFYGNGLSVTDSQNIEVSNVTTSGNVWGGIAVYTMGNYYTGGTDNVVFTGNMDLDELNPFYTEVGNSSGGTPYPITNLHFPSKFNYIVKSLAYMPNHEFYQESLMTAVNYVQLLPLPEAVAIEIVTGEFHIAEGLSIQTAIDTANSGDVIRITEGIYDTQLNISKPLTVVGAGKGLTNIINTTQLVAFFETSEKNYPIVYIHDTDDVVISNLTVDGADSGNDDYRFIGVAFSDAGGTLQDLVVKSVRDTPFSGSQHGNAIYVWDNENPRGVDVYDCDVYDYQKNGITMNGAYVTAEIRNCTVTGAGPTGVTAQNGIQFGYGATGVVDNCTVSGNWYTGDSWWASGGLIYDSDDITVKNCVFDSNHVLNYYGSGGEIHHNEFVNGLYGIFYDGSDGNIHDNIFVNNEVAIGLYKDSDAMIQNNVFTNNEDDILWAATIAGTNHYYGLIQAVVNLAESGDMVNVMPGSYNETVTINKPLTLYGAQANVDPRPSMGGRDGSETVLDGGEGRSALFIVEADDVEINGFSITGGTEDMVEESGSANDLLFQYNTLYDNSSSQGDEGIQIKNSTNVSIQYNYAYNIVQDAFNIAESDNSSICFNEAHDIHSDNAGIYCYGIENVDVIGNLLYNVTVNDGIQVGDSGDGSTGGVIKDNIVYNCAEDGISVYASYMEVENNTVYNCSSENGAMYLYLSDGTVLSNNTIRDNSAIGLLIYDSLDVFLTQNEIYNNNDSDDSKYQGSAGIWLRGNVTGFEAHDNDIYDNVEYGVKNTFTSIVDCSYNWWGNDTGPYHENSNPDGLGNAVSDNVTFDSWTTSLTGDWNPWNDPDSTNGAYIDLFEVIDAYNCYRYNDPAPKTGALVDIFYVIDMYNAYRFNEPM